MEHQSKKSAVIILPTYNEQENIEKMIHALQKVFEKIPHWNMSILIVDDSSPDGTGKTVEHLQKTRKNLHLLVGSKKGLGEAYKRGFSYSIKNLKPDYVFQMDADFQHDPNDIPTFLKATEDGYEFIIGSRYIPGGDCPNWEFKRKFYSWLANVGARIFVGIKGINDCTSGYRCIKAQFLENLNLDQIKSNGYAFQLSLLHAATKKKLKILEIPILFHSRQKGSSKLGGRDIWEFITNAVTLRFRRYK